MSHFSMFVPTKATMKLANGNTGHAQGIGIIFCRFPNCSIIYPVVPVYYCPGHPSSTISPGVLKFYVGFKKVTSEPLEHCDFFDPQGRSWRSPYQTKKIFTIFKSKISRSTLTETRILLSQLSMDFQNKISLNLFISVLVMSLLID